MTALSFETLRNAGLRAFRLPSFHVFPIEALRMVLACSQIFGLRKVPRTMALRKLGLANPPFEEPSQKATFLRFRWFDGTLTRVSAWFRAAAIYSCRRAPIWPPFFGHVPTFEIRFTGFATLFSQEVTTGGPQNVIGF